MYIYICRASSWVCNREKQTTKRAKKQKQRSTLTLQRIEKPQSTATLNRPLSLIQTRKGSKERLFIMTQTQLNCSNQDQRPSFHVPFALFVIRRQHSGLLNLLSPSKPKTMEHWRRVSAVTETHVPPRSRLIKPQNQQVQSKLTCYNYDSCHKQHERPRQNKKPFPTTTNLFFVERISSCMVGGGVIQRPVHTQRRNANVLHLC